jgi:hypothetical protein
MKQQRRNTQNRVYENCLELWCLGLRRISSRDDSESPSIRLDYRQLVDYAMLRRDNEQCNETASVPKNEVHTLIIRHPVR